MEEIYVSIYNNKKIELYCRSLVYNWKDLRTELIIQVLKMKPEKLKLAIDGDYLEYLCFVICKRIYFGRVKDSGIFQKTKSVETVEWNNSNIGGLYDDDSEYLIYETFDDDSISLEQFNDIMNSIHWYDKKLFDYYYKDNMKLREISELTGINVKSIHYSISKTRREIKKQIKDYVDNNDLYQNLLSGLGYY